MRSSAARMKARACSTTSTSLRSVRGGGKRTAAQAQQHRRLLGQFQRAAVRQEQVHRLGRRRLGEAAVEPLAQVVRHRPGHAVARALPARRGGRQDAQGPPPGPAPPHLRLPRSVGMPPPPQPIPANAHKRRSQEQQPQHRRAGTGATGIAPSAPPARSALSSALPAGRWSAAAVRPAGRSAESDRCRSPGSPSRPAADRDCRTRTALRAPRPPRRSAA